MLTANWWPSVLLVSLLVFNVIAVLVIQKRKKEIRTNDFLIIKVFLAPPSSASLTQTIIKL